VAPFYDVNGTTLFATDDGIGSPTVVLIHGWTCDGSDWAHQHDAFSADYRVITVDLRGHGRSSAPPSGYDPRGFAQDIAALLDVLSVHDVIAIGHSLGGLVASALSIERPDLVAGVVVVDPPYGRDPDRVAFLAEVLEGLRTDNCEDVIAAAISGMDSAETPSHLRAWHRRRARGCPPHVLAGTLEQIFWSENQFGLIAEAEEYLQQRACPVLAFYVAPERAGWEATLSSHPASKALAIDGVGHWLHQEQPEEFNRAVVEWIESLNHEEAPGGIDGHRSTFEQERASDS